MGPCLWVEGLVCGNYKALKAFIRNLQILKNGGLTDKFKRLE